MYYDMKAKKKALFHFKLGRSTKFSLRNSLTTILTVLVSTTTPLKENKLHTSAIIYPQAKFPKYRNFGLNRNISKRLYMKTRRGIIVITPRVSFFSQRLHMLFLFQTIGQINQNPPQKCLNQRKLVFSAKSPLSH